MAHCDLALMNSRRDSLRIKLLHSLYWISIELDRSGQYAPLSQVLQRHIARLGKDCKITTYLRHSSAFGSSVDRTVNLRSRKGQTRLFPRSPRRERERRRMVPCGFWWQHWGSFCSRWCTDCDS